jgi:hypothetical protein
LAAAGDPSATGLRRIGSSPRATRPTYEPSDEAIAAVRRCGESSASLAMCAPTAALRAAREPPLLPLALAGAAAEGRAGAAVARVLV